MHRSSKDVDDRGPPLRSVDDRMVLYWPVSVTCHLSSETAAGALVDIDLTSGGVGIYDAGGPFGLGVPCLDTSTAEGDAIEVLSVQVAVHMPYGNALCRTCLFGGPC